MLYMLSAMEGTSFRQISAQNSTTSVILNTKKSFILRQQRCGIIAISCYLFFSPSEFRPLFLYLPVEWVLGNRSGWQPAEPCRHTHPSASLPTAGSAAGSDLTGDLYGIAPAQQDKTLVYTKYSNFNLIRTRSPMLTCHTQTHSRLSSHLWWKINHFPYHLLLSGSLQHKWREAICKWLLVLDGIYLSVSDWVTCSLVDSDVLCSISSQAILVLC